MIDFVKFEIEGVNRDNLLANPLLDWIINVSNETGEVISHTCDYKGLHLKIFKRTNKMLIKGSLPKLLYGTNETDLTIGTLLEVIHLLKDKLFIDPSKAHLRNVEFGLNLEVPKPPSEILDTFLMYRTGVFNKMHNENAKNRFAGIECRFSEFRIKIYSKSEQLHLESHLLRFEIHVNKMRFFNKRNINLRTLADLVGKEILNDLGALLKEIYQSVFKLYEINTKALKAKDQILMGKGIYPKFWKDLIKKDRPRYYRQRTKFLELQDRHKVDDVHSYILAQISTKWKQLQGCLKDSIGQHISTKINFEIEQNKFTTKSPTFKPSNLGNNRPKDSTKSPYLETANFYAVKRENRTKSPFSLEGFCTTFFSSLKNYLNFNKKKLLFLKALNTMIF